MKNIYIAKPTLSRHGHSYATEQRTDLALCHTSIGLLTCCDRKGRFKWQLYTLKSNALPYDDVNFEKILDTLCGAKFIKKYTHEWQMCSLFS